LGLWIPPEITTQKPSRLKTTFSNLSSQKAKQKSEKRAKKESKFLGKMKSKRPIIKF